MLLFLLTTSMKALTQRLSLCLPCAKYQTARITNPKAIELIEKAINNPNIDITNIKLELLYDALEEDEYEKLFDEYMNIDYKKLNAACKKHNINYYKTNRIQKQRLLTNLNNDNLINLLLSKISLFLYFFIFFKYISFHPSYVI